MCQPLSPVCLILQSGDNHSWLFLDVNIEPSSWLRAYAAPALSNARSRVPSFHHSCITRPSVSLSVLSNCLGCILFFLLSSFPHSLSSRLLDAIISPPSWPLLSISPLHPGAAFMPSVRLWPFNLPLSRHPFVVGFLAISENLEDDLVEFAWQRAGLQECVGKWRDGRILVSLFSIRAGWKRARGCARDCGAALCGHTHTLASIIVMGSLCLGHGCVCVQHPVRASLGARLLGQLPAGGLERWNRADLFVNVSAFVLFRFYRQWIARACACVSQVWNGLGSD